MMKEVKVRRMGNHPGNFFAPSGTFFMTYAFNLPTPQYAPLFWITSVRGNCWDQIVLWLFIAL